MVLFPKNTFKLFFVYVWIISEKIPLLILSGGCNNVKSKPFKDIFLFYKISKDFLYKSYATGWGLFLSDNNIIYQIFSSLIKTLFFCSLFVTY